MIADAAVQVILGQDLFLLPDKKASEIKFAAEEYTYVAINASYFVFPLISQLPLNPFISGGRNGSNLRDLIFPSIGTLMRTRRMQASKIIRI